MPTMDPPGDLGQQPAAAPLAGREALTAPQRRLAVAWLAGLAGLGAYNWWVSVPFVHGTVVSPHGFFSDLSADGQPHAMLLQRLDLAGGLLLLTALVLRGRPQAPAEHRIWPWLVAFAAAAAVGGVYPYACATAIDPACRHLERTFQLPLHHYVHMASGVTEFFTATMAIALARITDPDRQSLAGRVGHTLVPALLIGYPVLGIAYLADRWGALAEPTFFFMFSAIVAIEIFGPGVVSSETAITDLARERRPAPG